MCVKNNSYDYYKELVDWMNKNERMPSRYSKNKVERKLGKWCDKQKKECGHRTRDFYKYQSFTMLKYWNVYK